MIGARHLLARRRSKKPTHVAIDEAERVAALVRAARAKLQLLVPGIGIGFGGENHGVGVFQCHFEPVPL